MASDPNQPVEPGGRDSTNQADHQPPKAVGYVGEDGLMRAYCPACSRRIKGPVKMAGRAVRCFHCSARLKLPRQEELLKPEVPQADEPVQAQPQREPDSLPGLYVDGEKVRIEDPPEAAPSSLVGSAGTDGTHDPSNDSGATLSLPAQGAAPSAPTEEASRQDLSPGADHDQTPTLKPEAAERGSGERAGSSPRKIPTPSVPYVDDRGWIRVNCLECKQETTLPFRVAGSVHACSKCGQEVLVPPPELLKDRHGNRWQPTSGGVNASEETLRPDVNAPSGVWEAEDGGEDEDDELRIEVDLSDELDSADPDEPPVAGLQTLPQEASKRTSLWGRLFSFGRKRG